jgi:hypothetical protein
MTPTKPSKQQNLIGDYAPHPDAPPMWDHQRIGFLRSRDAPLFALHFEQRTGKSRVIIDTAAYRYDAGDIDALIVVAMPSGVPTNWATDEIPAYLPPRIPRMVLVWRANKASSKSFQEAADALLRFKGLACLLVNGEAITTELFLQFLRRFMPKRRCMVVGDETTMIMKTPGAKRTKKMHAIGAQKTVVLKRILDGTPVAEGPLDLYAQYKFLDVGILGQPTFASFKTHYAEWEEQGDKAHNQAYERKYKELKDAGNTDEQASVVAKNYAKNVGATWLAVKTYRNMDELYRRMEQYSMRVLRSECFSLPPKIYQPHRFELTKEQRRVHDELREKYRAELRTGEKVTAQMVLVRYLRLQQIGSNVWPATQTSVLCDNCLGEGCAMCDDLGAVVQTTAAKVIDPDCNPRLDALREELRRGNPCIVWSRFTHDIEAVLGLAGELGIAAGRYDGKTSQVEKARVKAAFQKGDLDLMSAHPQSAGRGLPLHHARDLYYFSNTFSLGTRLQSEDRAEAAHKTVGTGIVDLIAVDTIDERILSAFRAKRKLSDIVLNEDSGALL